MEVMMKRLTRIAPIAALALLLTGCVLLGLYGEGMDTATDSPFGFHPASVHHPGYAQSGFSDALELGIGWAREGVYAFWFLIQPDLAATAYDFSLHDRQWGDIPPGIRILGNIAPQGTRDEGRCGPRSCMPLDVPAYEAFVRATVERYDGDGIDDMPNLRNPIVTWQVSNEPNTVSFPDFAELQRITYGAIKDACPSCSVLVGGVAGMPYDYIDSFDRFYAPFLTELAGEAVDVFDFHWFGLADGDYLLRDRRTGEDVLEHLRDTLATSGFSEGLPIWITEMGSYSGDPEEIRQVEGGSFPYQTEREQAADLFKRHIYSLAQGVEKIFPAFGVIEGFMHDDGYFDHTGLVYDGEGADDPGLGVKKLAYYAYRRMTDELQGCDWSTVRMVRDGATNNHVYLFAVEREMREIYIAWWDTFSEAEYIKGDVRPILLDELAATNITVKPVVPTATRGIDVVDYSTTFSDSTQPVEAGSARVILDDSPVIIVPD